MRKYVTALILFSLSFTIDVPSWLKTAAMVTPVQPAMALGFGFGRPPLVGAGCEDGYGFCIDF